MIQRLDRRQSRGGRSQPSSNKSFESVDLPAKGSSGSLMLGYRHGPRSPVRHLGGSAGRGVFFFSGQIHQQPACGLEDVGPHVLNVHCNGTSSPLVLRLCLPCGGRIGRAARLLDPFPLPFLADPHKAVCDTCPGYCRGALMTLAVAGVSVDAPHAGVMGEQDTTERFGPSLDGRVRHA